MVPQETFKSSIFELLHSITSNVCSTHIETIRLTVNKHVPTYNSLLSNMRRSLAKKGIDGVGTSTLAALLSIPTDPENLRISKRRPIKFVSTPRSQLSDMDYTELTVLEVEILRKIETVNTTITSLNVDAHTMKREYSKRRRSNVAVIIVRVICISAFIFPCLLLNHSFPTNPNRITNCF